MISTGFSGAAPEVVKLRSSLLQGPSWPALRANVFLGRRRGARLQVGPVPIEPFAGAQRNVAERYSFCNHATELEVGARFGVSSFARIEPFAVAARRSGQRFRRFFVTFHFRFGNKPWPPPVESAQDRTMVADKEQALVAQSLIAVQLLGPWRPQSAVIPRELHRWFVAADRKVEMDDARLRIGFAVALGRANFDTDGRFQLQGAKDGVKAVAAHV